MAFLGARDYAMRVWLDPDALAARGLAAGDVVRALREQNVQVAAGQLGQEPAAGRIDFQVPVTTLGRLPDADGLRRGDRQVGAGHPERRGPAGADRAARRRGPGRARRARTPT